MSKIHKINDDCIKTMKKLKDESIDVCITDCPYIVKWWWTRTILIDENWNEINKNWAKTDPKGCLNRWYKEIKVPSSNTKCNDKWKKKWETIVNSNVRDWKMFEHNDLSFADWLPELYRIMKNWTHTYIMINARNLKELQLEAEICANTEEEKEKIRNWKRVKKKWFIFQNLLVWNKWNFTPNKYYMQGAEFILMLRKWPARNINDMWSTNIINVKNIIWKKQHPTEKPAELYEYMLKNSINLPSEENPNPTNWIIDPFAWCWPIIEAWKKYNCNIVAIEIDKEYFEILDKR